MKSKGKIVELCEFCEERTATTRGGLCAQCALEHSIPYQRGLQASEYVYAHMVGCSAEEFREVGQRQMHYYKRDSDQQKFLAGWMEGHARWIVPHPMMVLELHDGTPGWRVGEQLWTNDWLMARREANRLSPLYPS